MSTPKSSWTEHDRPRVIVCGTRTFADAALLGRTLSHLLSKLERPIIVSGGQSMYRSVRGVRIRCGADYLGEQWAFRHGHTVKRFAADFASLGKSGGMARNRSMAQYAIEVRPAYCVAFHDGQSPGTAGMIEIAKRMKIITKVIRYQKIEEM